jgi:hypothetical protein
MMAIAKLAHTLFTREYDHKIKVLKLDISDESNKILFL